MRRANYRNVSQAVFVISILSHVSATHVQAQVQNTTAGSNASPTPKAETPTTKGLEESAGNIPQLSAVRGGTLGLPSQDLIGGVQAKVDTKLFGDKGSTDIFTKLAGIQLTGNLRADVFAEVITQDVPHLFLDGVTVKHKPSTENLSAGAIRIRHTFRKSFWVDQHSDTPSCKEKNKDFSENYSYNQQVRMFFNEKKEPSPLTEIRKACSSDEKNPQNIIGLSSHTVSGGIRVLHRSGPAEDSPSATGGAFELMYQGDKDTIRYGSTYFGGISGLYMNKSSEAIGSSGTNLSEFPRLKMLRLSVGVEMRAAPTDLGGIAPRIGGYFILSRGTWDDPYTFGVRPSSTAYSSEYEIGAYVAGKLGKTFTGMVAFRCLKPLGPFEDPRFIISVIPAVTSATSTESN